ncbi:MAG TPA: trypsin-like peptidase domain-containing protein [Bryobacteraceae bacterium]|nr:trypsin-like peptidase domain-containing protein [Bryobacteraceae bacterium]
MGTRLSLFLAAFLASTTVAPAQTRPASSPAASQSDEPKALPLSQLSSSLEGLVNRIRPAVVQIFSTGYVTSDENGSSNAASLLSKQRSTGSGIILSADGYIVTNAHVVKGARRIQVRLSLVRRLGAGRVAVQPEGKLLDAKLIGLDSEMDVGVIKIDRATLPTLALGDSDAVRQGELVMAFGNPRGLEGSVSMGIVSSTARELHPDDMLAYIQTDAPINPGNSGGPLIDSEGRVIGINTFILSESGGSEGLGFAIPSNIVANVYSQLRKEGHVHRGRVGMSVQTITPAMAEGLELARDWGVVVGDVQPGGPADKAGVQIGDIVTTLNHRVMHNARQLEAYIYRSPRKQQVTLGILRGKEQVEINVPVTDTVDDPQRFADMVNPEDNLVRRLGILVIAIDKKLAEMLPDLRNSYGLVVAAGSTTDLTSGTGLQPGDVIYSVNGFPVTSVEALKKKLDEFKSGQSIVIQIERSGRLMYVPIELE